MSATETTEARAQAEATPEGLRLLDFYRTLLPTSGSYCLWYKSTKQHRWAGSQEDLVRLTEEANASGHADWYFATAAFDDAKKRKQDNVTAKRCFYLDLDAGPEKLAKHGPDEVYVTQGEAIQAVVGFSKAISLPPTMVVSSGQGLHVYYALNHDVTEDEWTPIATALGRASKRAGLKVDASCTTDSARVLRPVGALHGSGERVRVLKNTGRLYTLDEFRAKLGGEPEEQFALSAPKRAKMDVNAGLPMFESTPVSALKVAEKCASLRAVAVSKGDVQEPLWRAMIGLVKHTVEGADIAHEWSMGYDGYDSAETQAKFDRYEAGPTTCETFGRHAKHCEGCEHQGKVTSPIQLGRMDAADLQRTAESKRPPVPPFVQELNERASIVIMGGEVRIRHEGIARVTGDGIKRGAEWMKPAAFHQLYADKMVTVAGREVAATAQWMRHPYRRQYMGAIFAPGLDVPTDTLNLYEGFGVQPVAGDVEPWLTVAERLIPVAAERRYVLRWLAWKVQNPGAVPGTILILTGGKGTGKNSLFEPVLRSFGVHGALYDDAEMIAGRFTGHLMTVCFAVLDEALFAGDPRQNDRIKARVTATTMSYEFKGFTPVTGVNRCAYVLLTNHEHVWHATQDERRAVVMHVGDGLRGDREFWRRYYTWLNAGGAAAVLHYLQTFDLKGFEPQEMPHTAALAQQVQITALRNPAASWWHAALSEGVLSGRNGAGHPFADHLNEDQPTLIDKESLRCSFLSSGRRADDWAMAMRALRAWVGAGGLRDVRQRDTKAGVRVQRVELAPLTELRAAFTACTGIDFSDPQ